MGGIISPGAPIYLIPRAALSKSPPLAQAIPREYSAGMTLHNIADSNGFNILIQGRYGYVILNKNDKYLTKAFQNYGECNELELLFLRQILKKGDTIFDIGANIGNHAMFFSRQTGNSGKVFSFEPQPQIFYMLCGNLALNSITNVTPINTAVGKEEGYLWLPDVDYSKENNFGGISLQAIHDGLRIPVTTLDHYIDVARADLIKIDVEGMEHEVISGAKELILKFKPVLFVENDRVEKSEALVKLIRSLGYKLYWVITPLYNQHNFAGNPVNIFPSIVVKNMYCHHESSDSVIKDLQEIY
jgi:FkbM family methyltransferase